MMRKLIAFLFIIISMSLSARIITPEEASTVAADFFSKTQLTRGGVEISRVEPKTMATAAPAAYYVFNAGTDHGFVIISADDRAKKILGYSDKGSFDFDNLPPQLASMLTQYSQQVAKLPASAAPDPSWRTDFRVASGGESKILETANWNQLAPYNEKCPEINDEKTPTGCVATAMGIVMQYHKWPEQGRGEHHYTWSYFNSSDLIVVEHELGVDFSKQRYNFDIMPSELDVNASAESVEAVGNLLYHAGVAVEMGYLPDGSVAHGWDIPYALKEYFQYHPTCQYISKENFDDAEWINLICDQIDNGNPIIYEGTDDASNSHAFVLDGYDVDHEYFHFNWGWGGEMNGYFALDASSENKIEFYNNQFMVINIIPEKTPTNYSRATVEYPHKLAGNNGFGAGLNISVSDVMPGVPFDVNTNTLFLPSDFNGKFGYAIVDKDYQVKELLWESPVATVDYGRVLTPETRVAGIKSQLAANELLETDRVQVVTKYENEETWRIVAGTLEAPSFCSIKNGNPNLSTITIDVDDDIELYLSTSKQLSLECAETDMVRDRTFKCLGGMRVDFRIVSKKKDLRDQILTFNIDGYFNGEFMNRVRTTKFDKDEICGFFETGKQNHSITAKLNNTKDLDINTTVAGELKELISPDAARGVTKLKISGPLDIYDMWYMNDHFQSLETLDLSDANFVESHVDNVWQWNTIINKTQPKNVLPDVSLFELKRLQNVMLPESLVAIGNNCMFYAYGVKTLEIPKNVTSIGLNFLFECVGLEKLFSANPEPPVLQDLQGYFLEPLTYSNTTLYVPKGSKKLYMTAPVWSRFENIEEYDGKTGIDGVDDGSQIRVIAREGVIIVEAPEGMEVEVYSIAGLRVAQTREHRIEGLTHGVYIVRVGGKAVKVVL